MSEDKAAARRAEREKRQARIKASGTNRLEKITGSAGSKDFKRPPQMQQTQLSSQPAAPKPLPTELTKGSQIQSQADPLNEPLDGLQGEPFDSDPLLQFLQQNKDGDSNPLAALLASMSQNSPSSSQSPSGSSAQQPGSQQHFASAQNNSVHRADIDFTWDALHFFMAIALGLYTAWGNPWNIVAAFCTLELVFIAAQLMLGHNRPGFSGVAMLAPFLSMLPKNRQRQLNVASTVLGLMRTAYRDMSIVLFVYGLATWGGHEFARPLYN